MSGRARAPPTAGTARPTTRRRSSPSGRRSPTAGGWRAAPTGRPPGAHAPTRDPDGRPRVDGPGLASRHPLNLAFTALLWLEPPRGPLGASPHFRALRLVSTAHLVVGSWGEEARLFDRVGAPYARYTRSGVPFFLTRRARAPAPWPRRWGAPAAAHWRVAATRRRLRRADARPTRPPAPFRRPGCRAGPGAIPLPPRAPTPDMAAAPALPGVASAVPEGLLAQARTLYERAPDGFVLLAAVRAGAPGDGGLAPVLDLLCRYVNPAGAAMLGREPATLVGRRALALFPSMRAEGVFDAHVRVIESGESFLGEVRHAHDGRHRTFRVTSVRVGDACAVTYADVTARAETERARDAALSRTAVLQDVTAALADARTEGDVGRVVVERVRPAVGARYAALLGVADPAGTTLRFVAVDALPAATQGRFARVDAEASIPIAEAHRTGRVIVVGSPEAFAARFPAIAPVVADLGVAATVSLPLAVPGRRLGALAVDFAHAHVPDADELALLEAIAAQCAQALDRVRLLAAERAAEREALLAGESRFRLLADSIPLLAWMAQPDGFLDWYNARWYEYTGTSAEQMAGWGWRAVHDPALLPLVVEQWRASVATGAPFEMEFPLRGADGGFRWFLTRAVPVRGADGRVVRWIGSNTDVDALREAREAATTARARAEEAAARADQASRAKSEFLATMSHELRTPLNAIAGYVQLLEMEVHGPVTAAQRDALERVARAQRHLLGLINAVLNSARLEAGQVDYDLRPHEVRELLAAVEPLVAPLVAARAQRYACALPPAHAALRVRADAEKVAQVLLNLVSNAVKFTPEGGAIKVGAEPAGEGRVALHVRDTGIGIPAERQAAIFDPFVQVDAGLTRAHQGVGLGLAISRGLARGMGGDLTVASVPGAGSTFTLTLPAA